MDAAVTFPFCETRQTEMISLFGSQLLFSQYRCASCGRYFEGLRADPLREPDGPLRELHREPHAAAPTTEGDQRDGGRAES